MADFFIIFFPPIFHLFFYSFSLVFFCFIFCLIVTFFPSPPKNNNIQTPDTTGNTHNAACRQRRRWSICALCIRSALWWERGYYVSLGCPSTLLHYGVVLCCFYWKSRNTWFSEHLVCLILSSGETLLLLPISEWYNFKPRSQITGLTAEEAGEEFARRGE